MQPPLLPGSRRDMLAWLGAGSLAACTGGDGGANTLRVADQLQYLQALFGASGEGRNRAPYRLAWGNFVSGPAVISAATGGSIDVGWMATTPLVFAQAAKSPVKVIAAFEAAHGDGAIAMVVRSNSPIRTLADLRGRRVCFALGTITQYFAYKALRSAGLTFADIQPLISTVALAGPLLTSGRTDALVAVEPLLSTMALAGDARVIARSAPLIRETHYLVAPTEALSRPQTRRFTADFIRRTARAMQWWQDNPEAATRQAVQLYKVPEPVAASVAVHVGRKAVPITPEIIAFQQEQADAFHALGQIPSRIDATAIFDLQFNRGVADG